MPGTIRTSPSSFSKYSILIRRLTQSLDCSIIQINDTIRWNRDFSFGSGNKCLAVPPVLNYAGQVTVNGEAFDGNGLFKFAIVNADGTTAYWSNDGTSVDGSEPQASVAVPVNGGLYSYCWETPRSKEWAHSTPRFSRSMEA